MVQMDSVTRVQILDELIYILCSAWERNESSYSRYGYGLIVGDIGLFDHGMATSLEEGKL